nr:alkaline phosphatase D family protein [Oceanococcus sp. HetDA_MAG_MS8]
MPHNRRTFLQACAASAILSACQSPSQTQATARSSSVFTHGVASGDPLADRVVFWTRALPADGISPVEYSLVVATDPALTQVVATASGITEAGRDFTIKEDIALPFPGTTYYYRFSVGDEQSPLGRTRTAPLGSNEHLRFAVVACSNYGNGYFNAYQQIARRADLDAVIHLGDYFYAGASNAVRDTKPGGEVFTLEGYRQRFQQYRTDPDLLECHRQHPFITIWDDHESANNSFREGARAHGEGEGDWSDRKAASIQAYFEWLPVREQFNPLSNPNAHLYRKLQYGELLDLVMLDTRLLRDEPPADSPALCEPALTDPSRQMLGEVQEAWLGEELRNSTAQWRMIGTSVMLGQWKIFGLPDQPTCGGLYLNADQWDGFQVARERIFDLLEEVPNCGFITGDIHSAWALDVVRDPNNPLAYNPVTGEGSLAVEFVSNSVTSAFPLDNGDLGFVGQNLHVKFIETDMRGYMVMDITPERMQADWWFVDTVAMPSEVEAFGESYACDHGSNRVQRIGSPSAEKSDAPALAPEDGASTPV